jgi:hypothetical protein
MAQSSWALTGGDDRIEVQGDAKAAVATYAPDGATVRGLDGLESFRGDITISSGGPAATTIRFTELEPSRYVWIHDVHLLTLTTPNATDRLSVPRPIAGAIEVSGTSGAVKIVPLDVTNVVTLVLDMATRGGAGNDLLSGGADNGVLIGGTTAHDTNDVALLFASDRARDRTPLIDRTT